MASSETLRSVIDAGRSSKRLDELSSARVIGKIAQQVHAAQQKAGSGKAIGPITPNHITLEPSGEAKLAVSETASFGYASPEQVAGGTGDRRSDVFSLGCVLWEVLTHQRLFDAMNDAAVKAAVQSREIQAPAEINANVPAELSAICMRALSRNPTDRYQSLKAMAVEIEEFLEEAGYADDDTRIKQFLVTIANLPRTKTPTAAGPSPKDTQPLGSGSRTQGPSVLTDPPVGDARAKTPSGAAVAAALANAGSSLPTNAGSSLPPASSSATAIGVPAAPDGPLVPMPPVLPTPPAPAPEPAPVPAQTRADKSTTIISVPPQVKVATTIEAKHVEAKATTEAAPEAPREAPPLAASVVAGDASSTSADATEKPADATAKPADTQPDGATAAAAAQAAADDTRATEVDGKLPTISSTEAETVATPKARAKSQSDGAPAAAASSEGSKPNPAAAVSLGPAPRDSKGDLLAGWGWGTGKHDAVAPENYNPDDEELYNPPERNKTLTYVIGGGLAIALLLTIVAFAAGGSKEEKKKPRQSAARAQQAKQDTPAPPPAVTPPAVADPGSAAPVVKEPTAEEKAAAAKAEAEAAELARVEAEKQEKARIESEKMAAQAKLDADKAAAEAAKAEAAKQEKERAELAKQEKAKADELARQEKVAKAEAARQEKAAKAELARQEKAAKAEAARQERAAKAEIARQEKAKADAAKAEAARQKAELAKTQPKTTTTVARTAKTDPKATAKTDPKTTKTTVAKAETPKVDVETAYRVGLQQFARGDTAGALASLRTSLAGNPNYAPTWRGLGLVFEKMGEKSQARAAYKRYLQLAPAAGDAEIIRGRLERLGS